MLLLNLEAISSCLGLFFLLGGLKSSRECLYIVILKLHYPKRDCYCACDMWKPWLCSSPSAFTGTRGKSASLCVCVSVRQSRHTHVCACTCFLAPRRVSMVTTCPVSVFTVFVRCVSPHQRRIHTLSGEQLSVFCRSFLELKLGGHINVLIRSFQTPV